MADKSLDGVGSLIPEFYFDLIARIVPGTLICFSIGWENRNDLAPLSKLGAGVLVPLGLVLTYAAGLILDLFCDLAVSLPNRVVFQTLHRITGAEEWQTRAWRSIRAANREEPGSTHRRTFLLKMIAEKNMLRGIALLWATAWAFNLSVVSQFGTSERIAVLVVLVLTYYRWEFVTRQEVLHALAPGVSQGGPKESTAQRNTRMQPTSP